MASEKTADRIFFGDTTTICSGFSEIRRHKMALIVRDILVYSPALRNGSLTLRNGG